MARRSLEDIANELGVDPKVARTYYEDVMRERNATSLPEVTVSTKKKTKKQITYKDIDPTKYSYKDIIKASNEANPINKTLAYGAKNFEHTFGVNPKELAYWIPGIGDALSIKDIDDDIKNKNYLNAAIGTSLMLLPSAIEKPLRGLLRKGKKKFTRYIEGINPKKKYTEQLNDLITEAKYKDLDNYYDKEEQIIKNVYVEPKISDKLLEENLDKHFDAAAKANANIASQLNLTQQLLYEYNSKTNPLLRDNPAFNYYVSKNNLDPNDPNVLKSFIKNQEHSIRGVYTNGDEDYIKYLTHADNSFNPKRRGNDMLQSRGLYTSNATEVSDKFNKAINNPNTKGYTAKLHHDFQIDSALSPKEQLELLYDRSLDWDALDDIFKGQHGESLISLIDFDDLRRNHPEIHSFDSKYFGLPVKQRAFVNNTDIPSKQVADIVDLTIIDNNGIRKNRFGKNDKPTDDLFIAQYLSDTPHNRERYLSLAKSYNPKVFTEEGNYVLSLLRDEYNKKYRHIANINRNNIIKNSLERHNKVKTRNNIDKILRYGTTGLGLSGIASLAGAGIANTRKNSISYEHQYYLDLNDKDFNEEYNTIMKDKDKFKADYIARLEKYKKERNYKNKQRSLED